MEKKKIKEKKVKKNEKHFTFTFKEWRDIKDSFKVIEFILKLKKND